MFGLFDEKYDNPALLEEIQQNQDRWDTFIQKLEARMDEMCMAALPELREVYEQDTDPYKRAHGRMLSGIMGQINNMRTKANEVREEKVFNFAAYVTSIIPSIASRAGSAYHDRLHAFSMACYARHNSFDEKINYYTSLLKDTTGIPDLETAYQEQLLAFEQIKDQFTCKQCGGHITISSMFFIATYVSCSFCHTQNTFIPSTGAQMVLHNARSLAEQRTAHLLKAYEERVPKDEGLYLQYLRSMFDEWNKIIPVMAEENEKFYQRLLRDHSNQLLNKK
jgi:hypothetical protein